MSISYRLSPRAQRDLDEIWDYSAATWGIDQAEAYTRQIWQHIRLIATTPSLGRSCPEIRQGYRKFPSGSHLLFYRESQDGIEVIRILHGNMDVSRHL